MTPIFATTSLADEAMPDADPLRIRRQALRIAIEVPAFRKGLARFEMPDTFIVERARAQSGSRRLGILPGMRQRLPEVSGISASAP